MFAGIDISVLFTTSNTNCRQTLVIVDVMTFLELFLIKFKVVNNYKIVDN